MKKENLDRRICECIPGATNTQTYREFILESEDQFGPRHEKLLDDMTDEELSALIEFYDYLWDKYEVDMRICKNYKGDKNESCNYNCSKIKIKGTKPVHNLEVIVEGREINESIV